MENTEGRNKPKKSVRILNGYRVIYEPSHPTSMKSDNWDGYIYEHIYLAEKLIGRSLHDDEVVHHLDGDRSNNRTSNLIVLMRGQHWKLEQWLDRGAPSVKTGGGNRVNSGKSQAGEHVPLVTHCSICGKTLQNKANFTCSMKCRGLKQRKADRPSYVQLMLDVAIMPMVRVGLKYGVSDTAIRKWIKEYEQQGTILSQAPDTSGEGAETTGEVQTS